MTKKPIRHGEILLYPVSRMPRNGRTKLATYIVGHSETGHHHVLESGTEMEVVDRGTDALWVRLFAPGELKHNKTEQAHKTLPVEKGTYLVKHKKQHNVITDTVEYLKD